MPGLWIAAGALVCAVAVAAGAFGAHGLRNRLDADALALWETATRYFLYGGFGTVLAGLANLHQGRRGFVAAALCLLVGSLIFSGTVGAIALGGPRWLGAITPIGGLLLIIGFLLLGWNGLLLK